MTDSKASSRAFFILALATGLMLQFYSLFFSGFQQTIWDQSDSRLVHFILEHGFQWLKGNPLDAHYLSPPVYNPHPGTLAYSELLVGALPLYAPLRIFFSPEFAYQAWMLLVQIIGFFSFYFLLTWSLNFNRMASVLGAFLFTFARFKSAQLGHFQLSLQFYAIFSIALMVRAVRGHPRAPFLIVGSYFLFGIQLVTSFYHAWFLSLIVFISGLAAIARPQWRTSLLKELRSQWAAHALGLVFVVAILAPFLPSLLSAKKELGPRAFEEVSQLLPRLASWFYMGKESFLYGWTAPWPMFQLPMEHEQRLGVGLFSLSLLILGTRRTLRHSSEEGKQVYRFLLGVTFFLFLWTLQVTDYTLWRTIHFTFPGGRSIRAVSRISFWLWIPLIIGLVSWISRESKLRGKWVIGMFTIIALEQVATLPSYPTQEPVARARAVAAVIPKDCPNFFYSPLSSILEPHTTHLDAMWAALFSGIPTINGYSGGYPRGWEELYNHQAYKPEDQTRLEFELKQWFNLKGMAFRPDCWVKIDATLPKP